MSSRGSHLRRYNASGYHEDTERSPPNPWLWSTNSYNHLEIISDPASLPATSRGQTSNPEFTQRNFSNVVAEPDEAGRHDVVCRNFLVDVHHFLSNPRLSAQNMDSMKAAAKAMASKKALSTATKAGKALGDMALKPFKKLTEGNKSDGEGQENGGADGQNQPQSPPQQQFSPSMQQMQYQNFSAQGSSGNTFPIQTAVGSGSQAAVAEQSVPLAQPYAGNTAYNPISHYTAPVMTSVEEVVRRPVMIQQIVTEYVPAPPPPPPEPPKPQVEVQTVFKEKVVYVAVPVPEPVTEWAISARAPRSNPGYNRTAALKRNVPLEILHRRHPSSDQPSQEDASTNMRQFNTPNSFKTSSSLSPRPLGHWAQPNAAHSHSPNYPQARPAPNEAASTHYPPAQKSSPQTSTSARLPLAQLAQHDNVQLSSSSANPVSSKTSKPSPLQQNSATNDMSIEDVERRIEVLRNTNRPRIAALSSRRAKQNDTDSTDGISGSSSSDRGSSSSSLSGTSSSYSIKSYDSEDSDELEHQRHSRSPEWNRYKSPLRHQQVRNHSQRRYR